MLSVVCFLGVPAELTIEAKRTAVREHRQQGGETIEVHGKRFLKEKKVGHEVNDEDSKEYDYYFTWDMYKYAPKQRQYGNGEAPSTKAPVASPSTKAQTATPRTIKKKHFISKKGLKGKGGKAGKGSKSKLSLKLSKSSGDEDSRESGDREKPDKDSKPGSGDDGKPDGGDSGGGNNGGGDNICMSELAEEISKAVPEIITRNPSSCCKKDDSQAVYISHAIVEEGTLSGFEPFWDEIYSEIALDSDQSGACFVFTGIDLTVSDRSTSEILIATNQFVRTLPKVVSMMSTDPTEDVGLITEIRSIWNDPMAPSIGVFNAGYNNIIVDSILNAEGRLPYVGYLEESNYGTMAANISLNLLDGMTANPLCFNARVGLVDFVGQRCAAYYNEISSQVIEPEIGISCSANSTAAELYFTIVAQNANAILSHGDCCTAVVDAVERVRLDDGRTIVVGCTDNDTTGGRVDFVVAQPIALQAQATSSWANLPVIQAQKGRDGRGEQYFPSLQSLVNTAIFNQVIL